MQKTSHETPHTTTNDFADDKANINMYFITYVENTFAIMQNWRSHFCRIHTHIQISSKLFMSYNGHQINFLIKNDLSAHCYVV